MREYEEMPYKKRNGRTTGGGYTGGGGTSGENLSEKSKIRIGKEGEKYAVRCLKDKLLKKYPGSMLSDTDEGFILEQEGRKIVNVRWLNKNGESGEHYDILVQEEGKKNYIEVKSTIDENRKDFLITEAELEFMTKKANDYTIYRVYNVGKQSVEIEYIPNPLEKLEKGIIKARLLKITI